MKSKMAKATKRPLPSPYQLDEDYKREFLALPRSSQEKVYKMFKWIVDQLVPERKKKRQRTIRKG